MLVSVLARKGKIKLINIPKSRSVSTIHPHHRPQIHVDLTRELENNTRIELTSLEYEISAVRRVVGQICCQKKLTIQVLICLL